MKLSAVRLTNFRAYQEPTTVSLGSLTALVGRNDAGKSTILDALAVFFDHPLGRIDGTDRCVRSSNETDIRIACVFSDLPDNLVLDASATTTLATEYLLNAQGMLEIEKVWPCSDGRIGKAKVVAWAEHPTASGVQNLLLKKNAELKKLIEQAGLSETVDLRSNSQMRLALWRSVKDLNVQRTEIPLDKEDAKAVWEKLSRHLPEFALFRADRPSTDEDVEVQDPLRVAIRLALEGVSEELERIKERVRASALDVAARTIEKLQDFDSELARNIIPDFRADPKWESQFKLTLVGDDGISVNKRGSGVRRLILFSFFRAEAERLTGVNERKSIFYAIEEPETAQHPSHQRMVVKALADLASRGGSQVLLTTHVPALASMLPTESLRHVAKQSSQVHVTEGGEILATVAKDLGVTSDHDPRAEVLVCVEGPHDVRFLQHANRALRRVQPELVDLAEDPRVAVLPLGGSTLQDWVNNQYLKKLGVREVHIYDKDVSSNAGAPKYKASADAVNARGDGSRAFLTRKREMENYLHPEAIREALLDHKDVGSLDITDETDVEAVLAKAIGGQKRLDRKTLKWWLNDDAAGLMTVDRFKARDGYTELLEWFNEIKREL